MRELLGKVGRFFENHVEKLVLVLVGLVCAWLFFTRVIFSPNVVEYDDKKFSPGQIDKHIQAKAEALISSVTASRPGANGKAYASKMTGPIHPNDPVVAEVFVGRPRPQSFVELLESPLAFMGTSVAVVEKGTRRNRERPRYRLPRVGSVTEVAVNHIRAAAYLPLVEVTAENTYDKVAVEPNDLDLVTVEAKFDMAELYRQFGAYFNGTEVEKEAWRDPCLAKPTFASVQLQRQRLLDDGDWSDWAEVPRTQIESRRELFAVLENVQDLPPGGPGMRLMRFDDKFVTMALLQPEAYQIASAEVDWFPPSFYGKFQELQRKMEMEERRKEREEKQRERGETSGRRRDSTGTGTSDTGAGGRRRSAATGPGGAGGAYGGGGAERGARGARSRGRTGQGMDSSMPGQTGRRTRSGRRNTMDQGYEAMGGPGGYGADGTMGTLGPSTDEVYFEFSNEMINYGTELSKMKEPLLFWAHDDSAEPGGTYRYRIRLGVFNPVAGTDRFVDRDMDQKDQVILWSEFSSVTDAVDIPQRLYFFAKDIQEKTNTAVVEVARYALGSWRTEDFRVEPGEAIGLEKEPESEEDKRSSSRSPRGGRMSPGGRITGQPGRDMMPGGYGQGMGMYQTQDPKDETIPDIIDYRTHAVLVDLVPVNDWGADLRPRMYHDMLYTADGVNIEHMPVNSKNWPDNLRSTYNSIRTQKRKEPEPFRQFKKGGLRGRGGMGGPDGMSPYGGGEMYDGGRGGAGPYGPTRR